MSSTRQLKRRADDILKQIAELGPMRKGSLCRRVLKRKTQQGQIKRRGPYWYYTFKTNSRTRCKMISEKAEPLFREQIERSQRFRELTREYADVSQQMADHEAGETVGKKNSRP